MGVEGLQVQKGCLTVVGASEPSSDRLMTCTEGFWKGLLGSGGEAGASVGASEACSAAHGIG